MITFQINFVKSFGQWLRLIMPSGRENGKSVQKLLRYRSGGETAFKKFRRKSGLVQYRLIP